MLDSKSGSQEFRRRPLKGLLSWLPFILVFGLWLLVSFDWDSEHQSKEDLSSLTRLSAYMRRQTAFSTVTIKDVSQYLDTDNAPIKGDSVEFSFPRPRGDSPRPLFVIGHYGVTYNGFEMAYVFEGRLKTQGSKDKYFATDFDQISIHYRDLATEMSRLTVKDADSLIAELRKKDNRAQIGPTIIPGGEMILFSIPMKLLMMLGNSICDKIVPLLDDPELEFEAALILGAIGDVSTVRLLINHYPEAPNPPTKNYNRLAIAYTNALCHLTGELIGRSRYGSDCDPKNKALWEKWWNTCPDAWRLSGDGATTTAAPSYPCLKQEDIENARKNFAEQ